MRQTGFYSNLSDQKIEHFRFSFPPEFAKTYESRWQIEWPDWYNGLSSNSKIKIRCRFDKHFDKNGGVVYFLTTKMGESIGWLVVCNAICSKKQEIRVFFFIASDHVSFIKDHLNSFLAKNHFSISWDNVSDKILSEEDSEYIDNVFENCKQDLDT